MNHTLKGFLSLIRLPNQFTLPGDILCGFLLAAWYPAYSIKSMVSPELSLGILIVISILIYSFGLIQNDLFGFEEDKKFGRSSRPLVSGIITLKTGKVLGVVAIVSAILLACIINLTTVVVTVVIAVLCTIYNGTAHKLPKLSTPIMGLCRGFNVILGASVYGWDLFTIEVLNYPLWCCIIFHTLYITSVTLLASNENEGGPTVFIKYLPTVSTLLLFYIIPHTIFLVLAGLILYVTHPLKESSSPSQVGSAIGQLIGILILSQMCWLRVLTGDIIMVAPIALCYLCNRVLSKMFYSS